MVDASTVRPHGGQCVATAKATGQRCRRAAIAGGTVCTVHGGRAPQVRRAAAARVEADRAAAVVARLDLRGIDADPLRALDEELRRCRAIIEELSDAEIDEDRLRLLGTERDRLVRVAVARAQLGQRQPIRQWSATGPLDVRHVPPEDHPELLRMIEAELVRRDAIDIC